MTRHRTDLSTKQADLLKRILVERCSERTDLTQAIDEGAFTAEQIEALCNVINAEFVENGVGDDFEPNEHGLEVEALMDAVNRPRLSS